MRFVEKYGFFGFEVFMRVVFVYLKFNSVDGMKERGFVDENVS